MVFSVAQPSPENSLVVDPDMLPEDHAPPPRRQTLIPTPVQELILLNKGVTREQVVRVFGDKSVVRIPNEAIPHGITHALTRQFLSGVGLPMETALEFIEFDENVRDGMLPLRESDVYDEIDEGEEIPGMENAYYLGDANGATFVSIALDGTTGKIYAIPEGNPEEPYLMNSDIESLVFYMYTLDRHKNLYSQTFYKEHNMQYEGTDTNTFIEAGKLIEREWREHDPAALEVPNGEVINVWPNLLDDIRCGTRY